MVVPPSAMWGASRGDRDRVIERVRVDHHVAVDIGGAELRVADRPAADRLGDGLQRRAGFQGAALCQRAHVGAPLAAVGLGLLVAGIWFAGKPVHQEEKFRHRVLLDYFRDLGRLRSLRISREALRPLMPLMPPPGWVPEA